MSKDQFMDFAAFNFAQLNEMDIREEIIAPLLRELGYRSGTTNNIIREQSLRYPRIYIGKNDFKKDPDLRGKADYICEVDQKVRWTIEAKSPATQLSIDDIEQAYSYSNHPEVRAVYFCLCNGREFRIYQTDRGPNIEPLITIAYEKLKESLDILKNVLSPSAILRDHPSISVDIGVPIGPGLRSIVRITGGRIHFTDHRLTLLAHRTSLRLPVLGDLIFTITGGAIERNENGKMVAFITTLTPFGSLQRLNERLGLAKSEYESDSGTLSVDLKQPTRFWSSRQIWLPAGERILDLQTWREMTLPLTLTCNAKTEAIGALCDHIFKGEFRAKLTYQETQVVADLVGEFQAHLA
jgi:hypothetical protein